MDKATNNNRDEIVQKQVVIKSEELINATYDDMTLKEAQLLTLGISLIPQDVKKGDIKIIRVSIERRLLGLVFGNSGYSGKTLAGLAEQLQSRIVTVCPRSGTTISKGKGYDQESWIRLVIVPTCEYNDGIFTMTFNPDLNDHFLELRERFTQYKLVNICQLASAYHIRLYELLVMSLEKESLFTSLEQLRGMLGIHDKYPRFPDFKRRVLDPAIYAINEETDLLVSYEEIRQHRALKAINFHVRRKEDMLSRMLFASGEFSSSEMGNMGTMVSMMMGEGFSQTEAINLVKKLEEGPDELRGYLDAARSYLDNLKIEGREASSGAIYRKAIQEKWQPNPTKKKSLRKNTTSVEKTQITLSLSELNWEKVYYYFQSNPTVATSFLERANQSNDVISLKALEAEGLESLMLRKPLEEFLVELLESGKLNLDQITD